MAFEEGVNVTWQLALTPVPDRRQLVAENTPAPLLENVTVPLGVMGVPGELSISVTVQVVGMPWVYGLVHDMETETLRLTMVSDQWAELDAWVESLPYVAVIR